MELHTKIEALLFVAGKPLTWNFLCKLFGVNKDILQQAVIFLQAKYNVEVSGIHIVDQDTGIQMVTHPAAHELIGQFVKKELTGELTRPQLETLTIIAYRGPINKPRIEELRGVNCSLIIRNLMIRGLIEECESDAMPDFPDYVVTIDFLRHMGLPSARALPHYDELHSQTIQYKENAPQKQ